MKTALAWLQGMIGGTGRTTLEELNVTELTGENELDAVLTSSEGGPVFLFKHSTTCPISSGAYQRVAGYLKDTAEEAPPLYLIKVIESRPLSNAIAARLGVVHQSPQIILVRGGKAVWNTSHGAITASAMQAAVAAAK